VAGIAGATLALGLAIAVVVPSEPVAAQSGEPAAWIVVDGDTGAVLDSQAAHEPLPVAGAVKLVTALAVLQRLPTEWDVRTTLAAEGAPEPTLGMTEGTLWDIEDVIQAMLLGSANDAAIAAAESASGTVQQFVTEMDLIGERIGLAESTFVEPAGIDNPSAANEMSAYDLAVVARNVLHEPILAEVVALNDFRVTTPAGEDTALQDNVNELIGRYDGATGLIFSQSSIAGQVLVASATRDERTVIAVVLGAPNATVSAAALLDEGFGVESPDAAAEGVSVLPDPSLTTAQGRFQAIVTLPRLLGRATLLGGAVGPDAPFAAPVPTTVPADPGGGGGGSGFPWLRVSAGLVLAALIVGAVLRHRAVEAERDRRQMERLHRAQARRRGSVDVIDADAGLGIDPSDVTIVRE